MSMLSGDIDSCAIAIEKFRHEFEENGVSELQIDLSSHAVDGSPSSVLQPCLFLIRAREPICTLRWAAITSV